MPLLLPLLGLRLPGPTKARCSRCLQLAPDYRSLSWVTIPQLKAMVTGPAAGPFDAAAFAESRGTLFMIMREGATSVAAPLFRALTDHIHRSTILAGSQTAWRKLSPGVFFALDEVANIGVPALAHKQADSAGYGAFFTIVIHSLAQLRDAYGPDKAAPDHAGRRRDRGGRMTRNKLPGAARTARAPRLHEAATPRCGPQPEGSR